MISAERPGVLVEGAAVTREMGRDRSLPEVIFDVVSAALADAGVLMAQVDSLVIAAHDLVDGRSLSSMITGPAAGAYLRDEIRLSDDGLEALALAVARIEAGEARRVVVAAWGRSSEGDPSRTALAAADPFTEQPFGLDQDLASALRASAYLARYGDANRREAARAWAGRATSAENERRSRAEATVYPLTSEEVARDGDLAAAVVIAGGDQGIRILGVGHGTDPARLGDRDLLELQSVRTAVRLALSDSSTTGPEIDVVELGGRSLFEDVLMLEAADLTGPGTGMAFYANTEWVNPTGGSGVVDCYPATGLVRFVDAVAQLRGESVVGQLQPRPRRALVAAGSVLGLQTATAIVVERT